MLEPAINFPDRRIVKPEIDLDALTLGATRIWVTPDGNGDGLSSQHPTTLDKAAAFINASGGGHYVVLLANGMRHIMAHPWPSNAGGESMEKPVVLMPVNPQGLQPVVVGTGGSAALEFRTPRSIVVHGIQFGSYLDAGVRVVADLDTAIDRSLTLDGCTFFGSRVGLSVLGSGIVDKTANVVVRNSHFLDIRDTAVVVSNAKSVGVIGNSIAVKPDSGKMNRAIDVVGGSEVNLVSNVITGATGAAVRVDRSETVKVADNAFVRNAIAGEVLGRTSQIEWTGNVTVNQATSRLSAGLCVRSVNGGVFSGNLFVNSHDVDGPAIVVGRLVSNGDEDITSAVFADNIIYDAHATAIQIDWVVAQGMTFESNVIQSSSAISKPSLASRWIDSNVAGGITAAGDRFALAASDNLVRVGDSSGGYTLWTQLTGGGVETAPVDFVDPKRDAALYNRVAMDGEESADALVESIRNGGVRAEALVEWVRAGFQIVGSEQEPQDPPADPEDPPVEPEDPPVEPEDPPVEPEDPPVEPENPPLPPQNQADFAPLANATDIYVDPRMRQHPGIVIKTVAELWPLLNQLRGVEHRAVNVYLATDVELLWTNPNSNRLPSSEAPLWIGTEQGYARIKVNSVLGMFYTNGDACANVTLTRFEAYPDPNGPLCLGMRLFGVKNFRIHDAIVRGFDGNIVIDAAGSGRPSENVLLDHVRIFDATSLGSYRHGVFAGGARGLTLRHVYLDNNGRIGAEDNLSRQIRAHNMYFSSGVSELVIDSVVSTRSAGIGMKCQATSFSIQDLVLAYNPIGFNIGQDERKADAKKSVGTLDGIAVIDGTDYATAQRNIGATFNSTADVTMRNAIVARVRQPLHVVTEEALGIDQLAIEDSTFRGHLVAYMNGSRSKNVALRRNRFQSIGDMGTTLEVFYSDQDPGPATFANNVWYAADHLDYVVVKPTVTRTKFDEFKQRSGETGHFERIDAATPTAGLETFSGKNTADVLKDVRSGSIDITGLFDHLRDGLR